MKAKEMFEKLGYELIEDGKTYLIYLKGQLIKQTKKEIQNLTYELRTIEGTKRLEKKRKNNLHKK